MHETSKSVWATWIPALALLFLSIVLASIYRAVGRQPNLDEHVPEFLALTLLAGAVYFVAVYVIDRCRLGLAALLIVLAGSVVFRFYLLQAPPELSDDVYRYQWEGRIERARINPYTVYPAKPGLERFQNPEHPIQTAREIPTVYPPMSEMMFALVRNIPSYKRLFTALDLASIGVLLLMLAHFRQPLHRVLIYAWNPTVIVAFALSGHHDSLAILTVLAADLLILAQKPLAGTLFLAVSVLSKFFPAVTIPVIARYIIIGSRYPANAPPSKRWSGPLAGSVAVVFATITVAAYVPFARAGRQALTGLGTYATRWEANDSLFRVILLAGNSRGQARLVVAVLMLGLVGYALKRRLDPLEGSLVLIAGALALSPSAFPWYFTWTVPFLCFNRGRFSTPWLLATVLCVLGYHPVVAYAAGQPYLHSPFMLMLEYAPVYGWLAFEAGRGTRDSEPGVPAPGLSKGRSIAS